MSKIVTTDSFIVKAKKIHGNKYDYSKVNYLNAITKICIICPEHGEFWIKPSSYLRSCRNPKYGERSNTTEDIIKKFKEIHGNKYDYSKVEYVNNKTKVCIICPEHGEFWQTPYHHLKRKQGCPICKQSHMENDISNFLNENNIHFIPQCDKNTFEWLNRQSLDFYLPDYNAAIECQGEQHFESIRHFGGEEKLKLTRELDSKKYKLCKEHGVRIIYYTKLGNKTFF